MNSFFDALETLDQKRWRLIPLLLIILLTALRAVQLGNGEIWLDEAFTWHYLRQPWSEVADFVTTYDVYPPLYFLYAKVYFEIFGGAGWVLRLAGLVLEVLTLPLIYFSAWTLAPAGRRRSVGLVALVLAGLSPVMIATALLARPYPGIYFFFTLCFAALSWIATHREVSGRSVFTASGRAAILPYLALAVGIAAMPWLHNLGMLYSLVVGIVAVLLWWFVLDRNKTIFWNLAAAAIVAALLYLPNVPVLLRQLGDVGTNWWLAPPSAAQLLRSVLHIYGQASGDIMPSDIAALGIAFLVILAALYGAATLLLRRQTAQFLLLVGLPGLVFFFFVSATYTFKPVLLSRAMYPMLGPWFVLLALSATSLLRPRFQAGVAAALVVIFAWSAYNSPKNAPLFGPVLATIASESEQKPVILTVPNSAALLLEYHAMQIGVDIDIVPLPGPYPALGDHYSYPTSAPGVPAIHPSEISEIENLLANEDQDIWVFLRGYGIFDPEALLKPLFDQKFCYQPVDGVPVLFHFVKLRPRSELASGKCTDMGDGRSFPYYRPDYGFYRLSDM